MTKKQKQLVIVGSVIGGIIILWLLLRNQAVPATTTSGTAAPIAPATPQLINNSYGNPSISAGGIPSVNLNLGSPSSGSCCNSCGCSPTDNAFASSVQQVLNSYSQQTQVLTANYNASLFGNIPNFIAQYIAIADPTAPG